MGHPFLMIRAVISLVSFVLLTFVAAIIATLSRLWDGSGDTVLKLARFWSRIVLGVPGVQLAVPVPFRFIAKKQLGAIPIFGWAMRAGRFIFIDRQNAASARRSIEEA